ncbi:hypothetical protein PVK06_039682 [Gossypium arboreum]|uniref:Endonuclease/exonuclease/phosphatase domain-containing protein n=1 Tax=Gossypium arboreum TaxID=29729 RepID=A0ABR0N5M3_GOSAR|nr:hypothetical protein PVK06_039682 [Gossypium arboreum]
MRQLLWNDLKNKNLVGQIPWMVIGDFNVILASIEKTGGLTKGRRCPHFGDFVDFVELHDLRFRRSPFTWHRGSLFKRLDRALAIKGEANEFFQRLYSDSPTPLGTLPPNRFPQLDPMDISFSKKSESNEEIKVAFFDMAPLKASGSDGFHAFFFKSSGVSLTVRKWNPIWLFRNGLVISHLFFADDLVLFGKADLKHCRILKDILDRFCTLSGHKINVKKTNIFFSKGMDEDSVDMISIMLGFQRVHNLGYYLGVPLLHQRCMMIPKKTREEIESYKAIKGGHWNPVDEKWKMAWKFPRPQRIRTFIWTILQGRILSNVERVRRVSQMTLHAISVAFTRKIFCTSYVIVRQPKMFEIRCLDQSIEVHNSEEQVHLFTDGAVQLDSRLVAPRGVVHDKEGHWIIGFHRFLGKCLVFNAKLWGVLEGLKIL